MWAPFRWFYARQIPKHYRYTLNVVADDKSIEKERQNGGRADSVLCGRSEWRARSPYEIIVFEMGKDQVKGYLSTPKSAGGPAPSSTPRRATSSERTVRDVSRAGCGLQNGHRLPEAENNPWLEPRAEFAFS